MLCVFAIHRERPDQDRRNKWILSFQLTEVEDEASWREFLADIKGRGIRGEGLKLIVEACGGAKEAFQLMTSGAALKIAIIP